MDVFDTERVARTGIDRMESFFRSMGLSTRLADAKIAGDRIDEMAAKCTDGNTRRFGNFVSLDKDAVKKILTLAEK
jgi:alcohol dehydrogenase YqhD (iron-dependent ADH family)